MVSGVSSWQLAHVFPRLVDHVISVCVWFRCKASSFTVLCVFYDFPVGFVSSLKLPCINVGRVSSSIFLLS